MSAAQKVQQHPAFIQASNKANYYVNQLDKEVSNAKFSTSAAFF
jgi:receptor expression-enhancing protein 5/6